MDKLDEQFAVADPVITEAFKLPARAVDHHLDGLREVLKDIVPDKNLDEMPSDPTEIIRLMGLVRLQCTIERAIDVLESIENYVGEK